MFSLSAGDLRGRILGCGDGPASFNAECTAGGGHVVSVDPIYAFDGAGIRRRFEDCIGGIFAQVRATMADWAWTTHPTPEALQATRVEAMELFLADYDAGRRAGRYIVGQLPALPLPPGTFDLALVSHLLLLYSRHLDEDFHVASCRELCRVASEVRIFPLLTLEHVPSPHLEPMRRRLGREGIDSAIRRVDYEVQRGGNEMLILQAPPHAG